MATTATKYATLVHLTTGHVLAAVASTGAAPTLADLTGDGYLPVRVPRTDKGPAGVIRVPASPLPESPLRATRIALGADDTGDLLDRPWHYRLDETGKPKFCDEPVVDGSVHEASGKRKELRLAVKSTVEDVLVIWQVEDVALVGVGRIVKPSTLEIEPEPSSASLRLISYKGSRLFLDHLPT